VTSGQSHSHAGAATEAAPTRAVIALSIVSVVAMSGSNDFPDRFSKWEDYISPQLCP
tara:strand:+ start:207 stop:377 length:171 start_codon:yes stop_codon:yes gene_type:complete